MPQLKQGKKKTAFIFSGSAAQNAPFAGYLMYSSNKIMLNYLARGLNAEYPEHLDSLYYEAGEVETNLNPGKGDYFKIKPD